jgi:hypothetical protein
LSAVAVLALIKIIIYHPVFPHPKKGLGLSRSSRSGHQKASQAGYGKSEHESFKLAVSGHLWYLSIAPGVDPHDWTPDPLGNTFNKHFSSGQGRVPFSGVQKLAGLESAATHPDLLRRRTVS